MIAGGVPAGANSANHEVTSKPGNPASIMVGTSGAVQPAAGLAGVARRAGARVVIVNPHDSELDGVAQHRLRGTAAALLPRLFGEPPEEALA